VAAGRRALARRNWVSEATHGVVVIIREHCRPFTKPADAYHGSEDYRIPSLQTVIVAVAVVAVSSQPTTITRIIYRDTDHRQVHHATCSLRSRNARAATPRDLARKRHVTRYHVTRGQPERSRFKHSPFSRGSIIDHRLSVPATRAVSFGISPRSCRERLKSRLN